MDSVLCYSVALKSSLKSSNLGFTGSYYMYIGGKVKENEVVNLNFHFELYKHICI